MDHANYTQYPKMPEKIYYKNLETSFSTLTKEEKKRMLKMTNRSRVRGTQQYETYVQAPNSDVFSTKVRTSVQGSSEAGALPSTAQGTRSIGFSRNTGPGAAGKSIDFSVGTVHATQMCIKKNWINQRKSVENKNGTMSGPNIFADRQPIRNIYTSGNSTNSREKLIFTHQQLSELHHPPQASDTNHENEYFDTIKDKLEETQPPLSYQTQLHPRSVKNTTTNQRAFFDQIRYREDKFEK